MEEFAELGQKIKEMAGRIRELLRDRGHDRRSDGSEDRRIRE